MSLSTNYDLLVLGAGAAGMLCAARAAERGRRVLLLEKGPKAGVKVLMSGGTRCNLTHDASPSQIADAYERLAGGADGKKKARFLRPALANLTPDALIGLFEAEGVRTKVEGTGKVFPASDSAVDVQRALLAMLERAGAELALREGVESVEAIDAGYQVTTTKRKLTAPKIVIAVGGRSYPGCGTTGDGYAWAKGLGCRIVPPRPALAPLTSTERWALDLQGVTLPDVRLRIAEAGAKPVAERRGSLLFTHFGLSGPAAMDASRAVTERPSADWQALLDFVPSLSEDQVREALQAGGGATLMGTLTHWVPKRIAESLVARAGAPADRKLAELTKAERRAVVDTLKRSVVPIAGTLGFKKAEVTAGGIDLADVDPRTMECRHAPGAYFIGEVLDLDGPIGGYNFQAAFSTGALAGEHV